MDVGVGSFSDPQGLEGLAHFLGEHFVPFFCFVMKEILLKNFILSMMVNLQANLAVWMFLFSF